jgi:chitinase
MKSAARILLTLLFATVPLIAQESPVAQGRPDATPKHKVIAYYPQWGLYGGYPFPGYFVKNLITSGAAARLTHLNYAFANVVDNQCASFDTWADFQDPLSADETVNGQPDRLAPNAFVGNFHQLSGVEEALPDLHIVISIGGGSADPNAFSSASMPENREPFVKSCIDMYIHGNFASGIHEPGIFDGIDIDWEFPATTEDETNFTALLREFRKQLDCIRPGMTLSMAAPAGSWAYQYIDLPTIQHILSHFNLMTYDFDGPWNNATGFVAPLYASLLDPDPTNNADYSVKAYLSMGIAPGKIVFGVPFYGYQWDQVPNANHGLFEPGTPVGYGSEYNSIVTIANTLQEYRDPANKAPWLYDGNNFWTFDDPYVLAFKAEYIQRQHLGGAMIWEISGDLQDGTLLKTLVRGLNQELCDK